METDSQEIGKKTILSSSFAGSPQALKILYQASFPKPFRNDTLFLENRGYPKYRHREGYVLPESNITNAWVVPYNPWLLRKYKAHINVEVCASVEAVKYLLSYVYKGPLL
jgi:hypothetical protein